VWIGFDFIHSAENPGGVSAYIFQRIVGVKLFLKNKNVDV
jgi:hypothetical protein